MIGLLRDDGGCNLTLLCVVQNRQINLHSWEIVGLKRANLLHFSLVVKKTGVIMGSSIRDGANISTYLRHYNFNNHEGVRKLKGVAHIMENEVLTMSPEANNNNSTMQTLGTNVRQCLQHYFTQLDGQTPSNLYSMVLAEVEKPLIEMVLKLTNSNQSKAALVLGISRGTLRKKMAIYNIR